VKVTETSSKDNGVVFKKNKEEELARGGKGVRGRKRNREKSFRRRLDLSKGKRISRGADGPIKLGKISGATKV